VAAEHIEVKHHTFVYRRSWLGSVALTAANKSDVTCAYQMRAVFYKQGKLSATHSDYLKLAMPMKIHLIAGVIFVYKIVLQGKVGSTVLGIFPESDISHKTILLKK
jgi:hypothetical protein